MAKTRVQKEETVKQLTDAFKTMKSVVFANFDGVKVKEADVIRKEAREKSVGMVVAKKSLLNLALKNAKLDNLSDYNYEGGVASFFSFADGVESAYLVHKFGQTIPGLKMLGGIVESTYYDESAIKRLAMLPTKEQLIQGVVSTIAAPLTNFMGAVSGTMRQIVTVLGNIQQSK